MSDITKWRFDNYPLVPQAGTWGNVVYDEHNLVWRNFYASSSGTTSIIMQASGPTCRAFHNNITTALQVGAPGAPDDYRLTVPYVWYENGETRPWRMIYAGGQNGGGLSLFLSTAVDAISSNDPVVFERKDTEGNVLSAAVLSGTVAQWDAGSLDFGSLIKVSGIYYLYYNTIPVNSRKTGLATSTDLVNWTKHADNPFFSGVTDYDDKDHDGAVDLAYGFFCPDIVYWSGTVGYVMVIPHYGAANVAALDLYTSPSPIFTKANRTFRGVIFDSVGAYYLHGTATTNLDTPRIITDDITRKVNESITCQSDVLMCVSVQAGLSIGWNECYLIHNKTLAGSILTDISADFPIDSPLYALSPSGDANSKLEYLFGVTGTLRDMTGGGIDLLAGVVPPTQIDNNGIKLVAANSQTLRWYGPNIAVLDSITEDFTIEMKVSLASAYTTSYRCPLAYGNGTSYHFYVYIGGAAGPTYTVYFYAICAGTGRVASASLGSLSTDTHYRLAITKTSGRIYFFLDGVLLNAGGTAYDYTLDAFATSILYIGRSTAGSPIYWDGYIDEIRISNSARWVANYTPTPLSYTYPATGYIFTPVYDLGAGNVRQIQAFLNTLGDTITVKYRQAADAADQSSDIGDFGNTATGQYQQIAITLSTSDTSQSPSVTGGNIGLFNGGLSLNLGLGGGGRMIPPQRRRR